MDYMNGWFNNATDKSVFRLRMFKRATGFFDVVAYTGNGSVTTKAHNLGVVPELMIVKRRSTAASWLFYVASLGG
jgi:hypothetical protein